MAEAAVLSATVQAFLQAPLEKAISLISEQLNHSWGFKKDLKSLRRSLVMVQAFLHDAETQAGGGEALKLWLQSLEDLAFEADNVLDEFSYEILRLKVERTSNQAKRKYGVERVMSSWKEFSVTACKTDKDMELKVSMDAESTKTQAVLMIWFPQWLLKLSQFHDFSESKEEGLSVGKDLQVEQSFEDLKAIFEPVVMMRHNSYCW